MRERIWVPPLLLLLPLLLPPPLGDYEQAVRDLEAALRSHRRLREIRARCARHCAVRRPLAPPCSGPGAELPFFRSLLQRARCYRSCETQRLGGPASRHRVSEDVRSDFQRRVPYNYLQRAYIKLNQLEKAVEAAHTFFMANPEHMEMQQNIENYRTMAGVAAFQLVDREARPHLESYSVGVKHYEADNFEVAIKYFEQALREYFNEDMECRILCEGPQRFEEYEYLGYKGGLHEAIADHYMQVLVCQHECVRELATRPGRLSPIENFLPLHYDYLQFAYYRVGEYVKALECAKAYLLCHPDDEDVLDNVHYYESLLDDDIDPASIEAREDMMMFVKRHQLESELIQSAAEGLGFSYTEPLTGKLPDVLWLPPWEDRGSREDSVLVPSGGPLLYENITFVYNSEQLNGTQRVLLDNVLSEDQCRELHSVASFGYEGRVPLKSARLFYDISEKARKIVESYFMLNSTLYFSYTHMVCRTALSGQQDRRNDLSHPIHADNCLLDPEANECWKEPPAYTFRDYSALLYMNDDFEGGEFIFTEMDAKTVTASIKPKCGRMISFSSGGENPHGVKAVTKGQRCAVALWFTLDPLYRELVLVCAGGHQLHPTSSSAASAVYPQLYGFRVRSPGLCPVDDADSFSGEGGKRQEEADFPLAKCHSKDST
ncbi:Prolyl 3-hydroxylase 2 [Tupaia chinensis]|uniref:procollagen-proline 3-dioxygenase n=1 Tax=Tupaia chinensis TaxID=246437 RepID=L9JKB2_TUPCH|nr:Prolyl 3-hydroxylase 2 [Tupaia chinensis]